MNPKSYGLAKPLTAMIFTLVISAAALAHNVYTTFTSIEWNGNDSSLEVIMQLHAHELEGLVSIELGERLTFLDDSSFDRLEAAAGVLILKHLQIEADGTAVPLKFLGLEMKGQSISAFMEADSWPKAPTEIVAVNSLYVSDLPNQMNTIMAIVNGQRRAGVYKEGSDPIMLSFK